MYCNAVSQVTLLYLAGQKPLMEDRHYQVQCGQDCDHRDTGLHGHSCFALQQTHTQCSENEEIHRERIDSHLVLF